MRIGELAEMAGTTIRTIRYYHQRGVLPEPARRSNGYREYAVDHLVALLRLRTLTASGLSLEQAGAIVADATGPTAEVLDGIDAALAHRIADLTAQRERLAAARTHGNVGVSELAAALIRTPADIPISTLFAHLYADDDRADRLAQTLRRPDVQAEIAAAQERFESLDETTTPEERADLARLLTRISDTYLEDVPAVEEAKSRMLLTLAERDLNDHQRAFIRALA